MLPVFSSALASDTPPIKPAAIPSELKSVIARASDAAARKDFVALRELMIEDFTWSFGGDGSADQAIAEWRSNSKYLPALASVTKGNCGPIGQGIVQCPKKADMGFRAGFKFVGNKWKLVYFVEGD